VTAPQPGRPQRLGLPLDDEDARAVVGYLLDEGADLDAADAVELLTTRLMAAIVTRDDDRQLPTRAQSAHPWEDYASDPWLRYRAAGLQVDDFASVP
jgi:hypothetical protein